MSIAQRLRLQNAPPAPENCVVDKATLVAVLSEFVASDYGVRLCDECNVQSLIGGPTVNKVYGATTPLLWDPSLLCLDTAKV